MITFDEVQSMFRYDSVTGNLIHLHTVQGGKRAGAVAGSPHNAGYRQIQLKGKKYLLHHIVWLYHHGYLPGQIDHINRERTDNRIENLRECTYTENHGNTTKQTNNTSGYKGVTWHNRDRKWMAQIAGEYIGLFDTPIDAAMAYDNRADELFGAFALTNFPPFLRKR